MNAMIAAEILAGNRRRSRRASPLSSMAYGAGRWNLVVVATLGLFWTSVQ